MSQKRANIRHIMASALTEIATTCCRFITVGLFCPPTSYAPGSSFHNSSTVSMIEVNCSGTPYEASYSVVERDC